MTTPTYPNIGQLAAKMSASHQRVAQSIDHLMTPIDEMVDASADGEWLKLAALGNQLSHDSREAGYRGVSVLGQTVGK